LPNAILRAVPCTFGSAYLSASTSVCARMIVCDNSIRSDANRDFCIINQCDNWMDYLGRVPILIPLLLLGLVFIL
jgi:hypothetical protein